MIYTMFGVPVKEVLQYESDTGAVRYTRNLPNDDGPRSCHISLMKADGGAREIIDSAKTITEGEYRVK